MSKIHQSLMVGISAVSIMAVSSTALADTTYTVKSGDTLWGLSRAYHTSVSNLKELNGLHSDVIGVGQQLRVSRSTGRTSPPTRATASSQAVTHIVRSGDTLWQLGFDHHTSVQALKTLNHLHSDTIVVGQKLLMPAQIGGSQSTETRAIAPRVLHATTSTSPNVTDLSVYTVKPGDTLSQIAQSYGIPLSNLKSMNHLNSDHIEVGQELEIVSPALSDVPSDLIPVYMSAGQKYGIPWTVLAAIHKIETDYSVQRGNVSSAGAEGPMQFLPTTFSAYGVTAPGRVGSPDIGNVDDAIYTAANYLARNGYATNPQQAIYAYNHSNQYVRTVMTYSAI